MTPYRHRHLHLPPPGKIPSSQQVARFLAQPGPSKVHPVTGEHTSIQAKKRYPIAGDNMSCNQELHFYMIWRNQV